VRSQAKIGPGTVRINPVTDREALVDKFLSGDRYDSDFCLELIAIGKARNIASWETRCLAALMLETHFLRIPARSIQERQSLARAVGCPDDEPSVRVLRRRLSRLKYMHLRMRGRATAREALLDFLHIATQPCRLWFARWFFDADEIASRILASVRTSRGVRDGLSETGGWLQAAREQLRDLPQPEQQVAAALAAQEHVYWVGSATPSEINGLVEYPLGTIVLVIKLPGSDLELEIKRVGLRGPNVLSALFARETSVPWPHRLQGGSAGCTIDGEARGTFRISALYRAIHGTEAPVSFVLGIHTVHTLPGSTGNAGLLAYFTEREEFGGGFDEMRAAMAQCVEAFEEGEPAMDLPGDLGLTIRYLKHLAPKQALISGTSSFRLDMLARYLSAEGPDLYFRQGLKRDYPAAEARRFANDLLSEVLGIFTPPSIPYTGYPEYVKSVLSVPANRLRADRIYLSLMRQIGSFHGTLAGLGAYTKGEVFVARNAGLRSRFIQGRWQVRICFMDHDNTVVPWKDCGEFDPVTAVEGMWIDARFILEETFSSQRAHGEVGCLRQIYQPAADVMEAGTKALLDAALLACGKTKAAVGNSHEVRSLIDPVFLRTKHDWDELVRSWLREGGTRDSVTAEWEAGARRTLAAKGFDDTKVSAYIQTIQKSRRFLNAFDFFFDL